MNVAGYIRVSTEQQKEEGSHETQREQLREWIAIDCEPAARDAFRRRLAAEQSDEQRALDEVMS